MASWVLSRPEHFSLFLNQWLAPNEMSIFPSHANTEFSARLKHRSPFLFTPLRHCLMPARAASRQQRMSCYWHLGSFPTCSYENRCFTKLRTLCPTVVFSQQTASSSVWLKSTRGKRCLSFGAASPIDPGVNSTSDSRSSPRTPAEGRGFVDNRQRFCSNRIKK